MLIETYYPLIGGILAALLAFLVLIANKRAKQNIVFAFFAMSFAIWLLATFAMFIAGDENSVIFWDRIAYIGIVFAPTLMFHYSVIFRGTEEKSKVSLIIGYLLSIVFLFISRTNLFLSDIFKYKIGNWEGVHSVAGIGHHFFMAYVVIYLCLFIVNIYKTYRLQIGLARTRARYIFYAFAIMLFGSAEFLPAYQIPIYPIFYFSEVIGIAIIAYTILRYRFMDIGYIFGRLFIYTFSIASVLGLAHVVANIVRNYFVLPISDVWLWSLILIFSLSIYPILFVFFEKIASKYFYYTFYSAQKVLMDAGKSLSKVLDIGKLAKTIIFTISENIKIEHVAIYLRQKNNKYVLVDSIGFDKNLTDSLVNEEFFTTYFEETYSALDYDRLPDIMQRSDRFKWSRLRILQKAMADSKTSFCLPLVLEKEIVGAILLGPKISGDHYSEQDEALLSSLASQASLALINARNYFQLQTFNERLETTVKKRTEELRDANEQLQKADRLKSEFVSIASHQLRSPLTVIKGYLSVILGGDYGQLADDVKKPLQVCYDANQRLINFTNDLLDLNAIEEGKMNLTFAPVKLQDIIDQILKQIERHTKDKKVEISFVQPKELLPEIQADASKIEQIFFNLIDNAIKYSPQGQVKITLSQLKGKQKFVIQDSGEGMTQDELDSIFEKFARGTVGKKVSTKGSGIGLFVAKKFVEAHKGKIWAESEGIGKGAKFIVELPDDLQSNVASDPLH